MVDGSFDPSLLATRDLRRLVSEMWEEERCDPIAAAVLDQAVTRDAKSLDRAILTAYLRHFPTHHSSFDYLAAASSFTAGRRDWPWRRRGIEWHLWDRKAGPARIAEALLTGPDAAAVLRDAGLDGDLAQGEFVAEAVEAACGQAARTEGARAQSLGERLIQLFDSMSIAGRDAFLAWALLAPWARLPPPEDYRDRIIGLLVKRLGDPRINRGHWEAIAAEMPDPDAIRLIDMVRGWLTKRTVRQFFAIIGATTNDAKQWAARESFWLAYLEAGAIEEAWFAFGSQAETFALGTKGLGDGLVYGRITGGGADMSHSALIMSIGGCRIAEWSHNGSCRFWDAHDRQAPALYQKQYFGMQLRAMNGGRDFENQFAAIPHASGWESKFAGYIAAFTGRQHPRHGSGRPWQGGFRSSATYGPTGGRGWG